MSLPAEARARMSNEQASLVAALVKRSDAPAGFDTARLRAAAACLARKRTKAAAHAWPALARALGERFDPLFATYADSTALPRDGGALADGRRFARWLDSRGELPDAARIEALAVDLRYTDTLDGLAPRNWPALRVLRLRKLGIVVVAFWLPWRGERWLRIPRLIPFSRTRTTHR